MNRACRLLKVSRSVYHYQATLRDDSPIEQTLAELAQRYRRYGFKKMYQKTRQANLKWNHKRVYRVYCAMGLNLRRKPKKRLPSREKVALVQPATLNRSWSLDYMSDVLTNGRRFRTANVVDDCNREALGIRARHSLPAERVTELLDEIAAERGYPEQLRVDNGPENISYVMQAWAKKHDVKMLYIQPGKPAQNAYIERFNRTYREEVLDMYLFKDIQQVQEITEQWRYEYNRERPHESLGNLTPLGFSEITISSTHALH